MQVKLDVLKSSVEWRKNVQQMFLTMLLFMRDYDGLGHLGLPCVLSKTCCYAIIRNYDGLWSSQSSRQPKKEVWKG